MIKLNLCCGKSNFGHEWHHIDANRDLVNVHQWNVEKLEYQNNCVDVIYCSHGLEYWDREEVIMVLNEWKRALKTGGILRLAVPDFEIMSQLYVKGKIQLQNILGPLYGKMVVNDKLKYHKTAYDFRSLKLLLMEVGFKHVKRYDWRNTEHAQFDDCSQAYLCPKGDKENGVLISLNVECKK